MTDDAAHSRVLLATLTVLTVASGLVDAVSYLGLGHVFTANMTGNIVLVGFAAAGAPGFSVAASLTSVGAFVVGAVVAGRICLHLSSRRRWLIVAMVLEGAITAVAAVVAAVAGDRVGTGGSRFAVIALLAFAMGIRNSTVRRLAVPDVTTTVLTMTLTGLAADSSLAGGHNPKVARRTTAVVAMFAGAFLGAALFLHQGAAVPLGVVAAAVLVAAAAFAASAFSHLLDDVP